LKPGDVREMADTKNPFSPLQVFESFWINRELVRRLTVRDVIGRYRGSVIGVVWSLIHPIVMLTVYTFIFGMVLNVRWDIQVENRFEFALVLFSGLVVFNILSECLQRAPTLIITNSTYVKKVVFPLDSLPWVVLGSALFHGLVSFLVLLGALLVVSHAIPWTALLFPLVMVPFILLIVGLIWLLSSLGVYLRDLGQVMSVIIAVVLFLSPIFYPLSMVPEELLFLFRANPMTFVVTQTRNCVIWGIPPDWVGLLVFIVISALVAWLGLVCFQKMRRGFADVL
jgi:lipopolysaccharide transport system permease protein